MLADSAVGSAGVKLALSIVMFSRAAGVFISFPGSDGEKKPNVKTLCGALAYCKTAIKTVCHLRFRIHLFMDIMVVPTHQHTQMYMWRFVLLRYSFLNYPAVSQW